MANRNQNYEPGSRPQGNYRSRDEDESRESRDYDRDYGQYAHTDEGERPARGGSYDEGRVQYGRRRDMNDTRWQSGSTGRYAGYGDFGRSDYSGETGRARNTGQDRYGQTGYGQGSGRHDFEQDNNPAGYGATGGPGFRGQDYGYGATGMHRGKGPKNYQRSEERIKEMLCERLHDDPYIDASEVTVQVQGGRITLDGTVESRHMKNAIEDIAEQVGTQDVQNNLRVQKQGQGSQTASGSMTGSTGKSTYGSEEGEQSKQKRN